MKRTLREDKIARITRLVRDQAYRACGYDNTDPQYTAVVWALGQVREEFRKGLILETS